MECLWIKNVERYQNLSVERDTVLVEGKFENFRETCIKTYDLNPAHFFLVPGLAWIAKLKMTEVESELLTNMDMVLTVDNFDQESEVEYVVLFFVMQKQITNIWSATMKTKNVHTLTKVICMDIQ